VVLDVLDRAIRLGETALAEPSTGRGALRRYLHDTIDIGLGVVNVIYPMLDDTDWPEQRAAAAEVIERLTEAARHDGAGGQGLTASDIAIVHPILPTSRDRTCPCRRDRPLTRISTTSSTGSPPPREEGPTSSGRHHESPRLLGLG
jgi:hypothetical protein